MARMIPPYLDDSTKSTGEKLVFELFERDPTTTDWIVLHSLSLSEHVRRIYGEIDFLVLAPGLGIFVLEIKSGSVSRKDGLCQFRDRFGNVHRKTRGPFQQAQEAAFTLIKALRSSFGADDVLSKTVVGYGVVFPHVRFTPTDLDQESWMIYDKDSRRFPINMFIHRLADGTHRKLRKCAWYNPNRSHLEHTDVERLVFLLRRDFERLDTSGYDHRDLDQQITAFTEDQYRLLDQLTDNERCLFQGTAGTGKTMLAIESARRAVRAGQRVVLVCFNRLLGLWLRMLLRKEDYEKVTVASLHSLLYDLADHPSLDESRDKFFKETLPLIVLEKIDAGEICRFDKLIVDEGQDLISPNYLDIFDALLVGGLAGGCWEFYCDFERQAIYSHLSASEMQSEIDSRGVSAKFRLTTNCRNSRKIGQHISRLCRFPPERYLPSRSAGPPVEHLFYDTDKKQIELLSRILRELRHNNITPDLVTLLSEKGFTAACGGLLCNTFPDVSDAEEPAIKTRHRLHPQFATVRRFKGMESQVVILLDVDELDDVLLTSILYVGMSRARSHLFVLCHERTRTSIDTILAGSIQ